ADRRALVANRVRDAARRRSRVRRPRDGGHVGRKPPDAVACSRSAQGTPRRTAWRVAMRGARAVPCGPAKHFDSGRLSRPLRMRDTQLVMYDEDYRRILGVVERLVRDANAKGVFVVDRNGQLIPEAGERRGIDTTSLASLTPGCFRARAGLA